MSDKREFLHYDVNYAVFFWVMKEGSKRFLLFSQMLNTPADASSEWQAKENPSQRRPGHVTWETGPAGEIPNMNTS